ncbi:MAG: terephthalate 1,2-dioxygenase oxygenase component beta chain [Herminiimonas sp.]|jgi:3-phenylpropionate/cinnamic acid dioxygenase small subunit|nr:terephthalate 1,2-dioxygenase oxygenase component beta chain [Herminiimonas sp.]
MAMDTGYEALIALNAAYARCIDEDQLEAWPDFFLEDCLYKITTAENYRQGMQAGLVYADSRGMLQDRVTALREANIYERQRYRHILSVPTLLAQEARGTVSETPFLVARIVRGGETTLFVTGKYIDVVAPDAAGQARFVERVVVCDSSSIDTLLAIPL